MTSRIVEITHQWRLDPEYAPLIPFLQSSKKKRIIFRDGYFQIVVGLVFLDSWGRVYRPSL